MNASVHESLRRAAPFRSTAVAAIRRLLKFRIISLFSEGRRPDAEARELRDSDCGVEPLEGYLLQGSSIIRVAVKALRFCYKHQQQSQQLERQFSPPVAILREMVRVNSFHLPPRC